MADFDPDAYLLSKSKAPNEDYEWQGPPQDPHSPSGFDPDAYLAEKEQGSPPLTQQEPAPITSADINRLLKYARANPNDPRAKALLPKLEAMEASAKGRMGKKIVRGMQVAGADAASLGWADEILGAIRGPEEAEAYKKDLNEFRDEHPVMAFGSSLAGSLPLSVLTGGLGASAIQGAIGGLGNAENKSLGDAALGAGAGAATHGLGKLGGKALQYGLGKASQFAGKAGQMPQQAYESIAEWLGKNSDAIGKASVKPSSGSKLQQGLAEAIDNGALASMGSDAGGAAVAAESAVKEQLGSAASKVLDEPMGSLDATSRSALMGAMVIGLKKRGLNTTADVIGENFDELVRAAGKEPSDVTAREAMRLVNQRDPAFAQALVRNVNKRWAPMRKGMPVDPREAELLKVNNAMLDDVARGNQNRFNVPNAQSGRAQLPLSDLEPPSAVSQTAAGGSAKLLYNPRGPPTSADDEVTREALERLRERNPNIDYAKIRASYEAPIPNPRPPPVKSPTIPANAEQAIAPWMAGAEKAGAEAADRMRNINAGKARYDNLLGMAAIPGLNVAAAPVASLASSLKLAGSDRVAGLGRAVESFGDKMTSPDSMTRSWLANPTLLRPIAQRQDQIGRGARFVLEGLNEGQDAFKSRLLVLSFQPWWRAEFVDSAKH